MNATNKKSEEIIPEVGMGATECSYTDRSPYTIVWVSESGKTIRVQLDKAVRTDNNGMSECQDYLYLPNPAAEIVTVRLTKSGWKSKYGRYHIGSRRKYHDYSF